MLRRAWPIVVATCALLAACVDDQQALRSSEPLYTMVFFASDSTALSKRARDQIADFVANPMGPIKTMPKAKICVGGHSDKTGTEPVNREVAQRRADAVTKYLVELGVPQERIVTASLGSSKPLVVTATADVGDFQSTRRDRRRLSLKMRRRLGALCALSWPLASSRRLWWRCRRHRLYASSVPTGSSVLALSKDNDNVLQSAAETFGVGSPRAALYFWPGRTAEACTSSLHFHRRALMP